LSAAALLINFWITDVSNGVWIAVSLVVITAINMGGARTYAECEFWFASIKIFTIVGLMCVFRILSGAY
jgi:amino acid transporter